MTRRLTLGLVFCTWGLLAQPGQSLGQQSCAGDCNGDGTVAINEVITCVNIGLELLPLSNCTACDANNDGSVTINEIITSVNIGLGTLPCGDGGPTRTPTTGGGEPTRTPTIDTGPTRTAVPGDAICGNSILEQGEQCDDGNNFGGDGCARNCTDESPRPGIFEDDPNSVRRTVSVVQTAALPIQVFLVGGQVYVTGESRDTPVVDPEGNVVSMPGDIPVVIPADMVAFEPVSVPGLVCACVRGIPDPLFGPGNSGNGTIGCGENGIVDNSYNLEQDHNTTPGSAGNGGGLPNDPECTRSYTFPSGVESVACVEGDGDLCKAPEDVHRGRCTDGICTGQYGNVGAVCAENTDCGGVCRSPRFIASFTGGRVPRGSALIDNSTSISLLRDAGVCMESRLGDGSCRFAQYGPDCLPCTDDDLVMEAPESLPTTTGTAQATLYDSNNVAGAVIEMGASCLGRPCITGATGALFDCDALEAGPGGGIGGSGLATAFPAADSAQIGDNVTSTVLNHR